MTANNCGLCGRLCLFGIGLWRPHATGRPAGVGKGCGAPAHNERCGFNDAAISYGAAPYTWLVERETPGG